MEVVRPRRGRNVPATVETGQPSGRVLGLVSPGVDALAGSAPL